MTQPALRRAPPRIVLVLLIVGIALNLRPFLAAPGPILPRIAADTGMGPQALSLLTLAPMLLMGFGAFLVPRFLTGVRAATGLSLALGLLGAGSLLRGIAPDGPTLILTAGLCGAGVAFVQSALPGLIKEAFPESLAMMTGLYSAMIMVGGALGAQLTPLLVAAGIAWPTALAWLALPALLAAIAAAWIFAGRPASGPAARPAQGLLQRPRIWTLMVVFGLINGGYSSLIAWLAPFYQSLGWSSGQSGTLVAVMAISQGCGAVLVPMLARRHKDRRPWLWATIAFQLGGFCGFAFAPLSAPALWAGLSGFGLAGSFALCLIVALDHAPQPARAGAVAALMQGGGFLITAFPPLILAWLHEATGTFLSGWLLHLAALAAAAVVVHRFDPRGYARALGEAPAAHRPAGDASAPGCIPPATGAS